MIESTMTSNQPTSTDEQWMALALSLACSAGSCNEVPVGAIVVDTKDQTLISSGYNLRESRTDCTLHAEMIAIRAACNKLESWRLHTCKLYVSLEPCIMCAGAIYQARIPEVHFAARDPKGGACGSLFQIHQDQRLNHQFLVVEHQGAAREQSSTLLKNFFQKKRREKRK